MCVYVCVWYLSLILEDLWPLCLYIFLLPFFPLSRIPSIHVLDQLICPIHFRSIFSYFLVFELSLRSLNCFFFFFLGCVDHVEHVKVVELGISLLKVFLITVTALLFLEFSFFLLYILHFYAKVTILSCMTFTFSIRDFIILITLILTLYSEISDIHVSSIDCFCLLKFTVYFLL